MKSIRINHLLIIGFAAMLVTACSSDGSGVKKFTKKWNYELVSNGPIINYFGYLKINNLTIDCEDKTMPTDPKYGRKCKVDYTKASKDFGYLFGRKTTEDFFGVWNGGMIHFIDGFDIDISDESSDTAVYVPYLSISSKFDEPMGQCQFEWKDTYLTSIRDGKKIEIQNNNKESGFDCKITLQPIYE